MNDLFTLELPREAGGALADIRQAVAALDGVADSGELTTRGLDPASIGLWVQLATSAAGVATTLAGVLTTVFGLVRQKGIKGAKLRVGEIEIELGEVSVEEFDKILTRLKAPGGGV